MPRTFHSYSNSLVRSVPASTDLTTLAVGDGEISRVALTIYNDSDNALFIKLGIDAGANSFTLKIPTLSYWECPYPVYDGLVTGFWDGTDGSAMVTEIY